MIFGGFGARRLIDGNVRDALHPLPLPGLIVGYGGGTFNMDGSVATPNTRGVRDAPIDDGASPQAGAPSPVPSSPEGLLSTGAMRPRGIFGGPVQVSSSPATQAQSPGTASPKPMASFDYAGTQASLLPHRKGSKFVHTLADIASVLGPALMASSGDGAGASAAIASLNAQRADASRRQWEANRMLAEWKHQDWARQNTADLDASQPFTLGRSRYQYDPTNKQTTMLQHEPADFEDYAATMGYEPGSPQYVQAAQDYILRGNGPTAVGLDMSLDDYRTGNRTKLENLRQNNRMDYQRAGIAGRAQIKATPTYRDTHPLPQRGGGGRAAGSAPTATGPNGEKIMWNGSAWVPAK